MTGLTCDWMENRGRYIYWIPWGSVGSFGGVGAGGFFVPMLTLIIGFDQKSSAAISKFMITGGAAATVLYNLRLRHPTLELPLIDYVLALLLQPMLVLEISIGVSLNVVLSEWMITTILIVVLLDIASEDIEGRNIHGGAGNNRPEIKEVSVLRNVYWKQLGVIFTVWILILGLQIGKDFT
ncbi:sulfite exporter TauE/SafE family protein 3-like [Pyrus x bretschneideri]|uniref:sulfite exporter TauE/SafE family protein 3-like n=1 Tax=Pyrus x bretschneideri TaxID=225117 RepID=UPI002030A798|nr:sulfite exporter TauE/SafE family protein 3-like [Pyrus x bretschneideri]